MRAKSGNAWARVCAGDRGTMLVQAVAAVVLLLAVVLVLTDASTLYLRRAALMAVADDAALAAASAVDVGALYANGVGEVLPLDGERARTLAERAVATAHDDRLRDLRLDSVQVSASGVEVVVSAAVPSPVSGITGERTLRLRARAGAQPLTRW